MRTRSWLSVTFALGPVIASLAIACAGGSHDNAAPAPSQPEAGAVEAPKQDASTPPPAKPVQRDAAADASANAADASGRCPAKQILCNGKCIDSTSDPANCGRCGFDCKEGETCSKSTCVAPAGTKTCATLLQLCLGYCTSTLADPLNCGACGHTCNVLNGELCVLGKCQGLGGIFGGGGSSSGGTGGRNGSCGDPSLQMCDGFCVGYDDLDNCGQCGNACDVDTETCNGTSCVPIDSNGGGGCPASDPCCSAPDPYCCAYPDDPTCNGGSNNDPCVNSADPYCCYNPDDPACATGP